MMTSREVIDLFNQKLSLTNQKPIEYPELRKAMRELGIRFKSKVVDGATLTCYLSRKDIHDLALHMGVRLYKGE